MKQEDLKIEPFSPFDRAGWSTGNVPNGARVTHIPSGLSASSHLQRSQSKNLKLALSMIEWGLAEIGHVDVQR